MGPTAFGGEDEEEATDERGSTRIEEDHFAPAHRRKKYSARKKQGRLLSNSRGLSWLLNV
jgi:hypothetical protein